MSRQDDQGGWKGKTDRAATWAEFDALPRGVKRLYWYAPYDYTPIGAFRAWLNNADMRARVERQRAAHLRDVIRESTRLYGDPQMDLQA